MSVTHQYSVKTCPQTFLPSSSHAFLFYFFRIKRYDNIPTELPRPLTEASNAGGIKFCMDKRLPHLSSHRNTNVTGNVFHEGGGFTVEVTHRTPVVVAATASINFTEGGEGVVFSHIS